MADEKTTTKTPTKSTITKSATTSSPAGGRGTRTSNNRRQGGGKRRNRRGSGNREFDKYDKRIVSIRRVTRVYKGGKRMRLSVVVVAGDKQGKVGVGLGKGADVRTAEEKAMKQAIKNMVEIKLKGNTIPHTVDHKKGAARVFLKPAAPGTGIIAGGAVRAVVELAGVKDVLSKIIGTNNQISNVYATIEALADSKTALNPVTAAAAVKATNKANSKKS